MADDPIEQVRRWLDEARAFGLPMPEAMTLATSDAAGRPSARIVLLHGIEANFLSPIFMGHRLRLRPVFVFLSVMVWGWLWGIAGAFLAVPLLLALRAFCKRTRNLRLVCVYLDGD